MNSSTASAVNSRATLIGSTAILFWAVFASLASLLPKVPPLELTAAIFSVAFLVSGAQWIYKQQPVAAYFKLPLAVWANGIFGFFGYQMFFFVALKLAPAVEVNLINYLWPLLIVLFSGFLPGEKLRWYHLAGAALGLCGIVVLIGGKGLSFNPAFIPGYASALGCAVTWSVYSVLSRRFSTVPSGSIGAFYIVCALLSWVLHFIFETNYLPETAIEWVAIAAIGLGPIGFAFLFWDQGMKHGDVRLLGILSFATPLLSTLILLLVSRGTLSWPVAAAAMLIVFGGVVGAGLIRRKR